MRFFPLLFLLLAVAFTSRGAVRAAEVLYEDQSRYHLIRVIQSGSIRTLTFRRKGSDRNQSKMDMADTLRPCLPYYRLMFAGYLFVPKPERILVVGLGGGVISHLSAHYFPETHVDTVELDPAVVEVAKKFFGFQEGPRNRVFARDARVQIRVFRNQGVVYDIIMLDAFSGGYIPEHLITKEFYEECRDILSPEGALVVNLRLDWVIYQYQRRTLAAVFAEQYPFGGASGSEVVVALPSKRNFTKDKLVASARSLQEERKFSFNLPDIASQFDMGPGFHREGLIFTDGHVPANILKQQLEDPFDSYKPPARPFDRVAAWLKSHRLPVISLALVFIVAVYALHRRKSSSASWRRGERNGREETPRKGAKAQRKGRNTNAN